MSLEVVSEDATKLPRRRLLLIGNYPPPYGGIPTVNKYLVEHLVERNWEIFVISGFRHDKLVERPSQNVTVFRAMHKHELLASLVARPFVGGAMKRFWHLCPTVQNFLFCSAFYRFTKSICVSHSIDAVLACKVLFGGVMGAMLKEELNIPLITSVWGEGYEQRELFRSHAKAVQFVADRCDKWLSTSNHCAGSVATYGLRQEINVETIYHGVDTQHFVPAGPDPSIERSIGNESNPVVMFCGRMTAEMGLHVLLEAIPLVLNRLPLATFVIVGATYELTQKACELSERLPGRVFVHENVAYADLPKYYSCADIVVAPSTNDRACLGLAIIEAMACEKPVIASNVGGTSEVIADGIDGVLVSPNDAVVLANSIVELSSNAVLRKSIGTVARETAVNRFDKSVNNHGVEQILNNLLAQKATNHV